MDVVSQGAVVVQLPGMHSLSVLDQASFTRLYDRCADDLLVFFTRRTLDPQIALDLWAETFAQAFAARRRFRGRDAGQAKSWLYGIAYRQLAHYYRRGQAEMRALERLGLQQPAFAEDDVARLIERADVSALRGHCAHGFSRLRPPLREAVRLRVIRELPYEQVAILLGVSEQAARARVSRGLRALQHEVPHDLPTPTRAEVTP